MPFGIWWWRGVVLATLGVASPAQMLCAERKNVSLNDGWEFRQDIRLPSTQEVGLHAPVKLGAW